MLMMNLHILYFIVTQPRQFVTIFFSSHPNKMFRFPSPCVLRWWVGRSGKRKKKENEHLKGSDSREGRPPPPSTSTPPLQMGTLFLPRRTPVMRRSIGNFNIMSQVFELLRIGWLKLRPPQRHSLENGPLL